MIYQHNHTLMTEQLSKSARQAVSGITFADQRKSFRHTDVEAMACKMCLTLNGMCCSTHGRVHAIVRARTGDEARERLRASFDSGSSELLQLFDTLSRNHLSVHAGELRAHTLRALQCFCVLILPIRWPRAGLP